MRWKLLLKDPAIPYRECYAFLGVGSALAVVSPSSLLADGAAGYRLDRRRQGVLRALSAPLAARVLGVGAGATLALRHPDKLARIVDRTLPILKDPISLGSAMALSLAVQFVQMSAHWIAYRAIGAPVAYADILFFLPLITLLGMAPVSLGGMGVREGLGIFFYTLLPGVGREAVLAEAGFRYLLMAAMAAVNLAVAAAVLGGFGRLSARSPQPGATGVRAGAGLGRS